MLVVNFVAVGSKLAQSHKTTTGSQMEFCFFTKTRYYLRLAPQVHKVIPYTAVSGLDLMGKGLKLLL